MSDDHKIHRRVAEVLGMAVDEEDPPFMQDADIDIEEPAIIALPEVVAGVENPELPVLQEELIRIEHGQRQTEVLLERGLTAVQKALAELPLITPQYKPRAMEAAAELFKAVADLSKFKVEVQIKLTELKMKQASFVRSKSPTNPLGSGNTFVINREELIRAYQKKIKKNDGEDDDDDES